jgi:hypothetical protein
MKSSPSTGEFSVRILPDCLNMSENDLSPLQNFLQSLKIKFDKWHQQARLFTKTASQVSFQNKKSNLDRIQVVPCYRRTSFLGDERSIEPPLLSKTSTICCGMSSESSSKKEGAIAAQHWRT